MQKSSVKNLQEHYKRIAAELKKGDTAVQAALKEATETLGKLSSPGPPPPGATFALAKPLDLLLAAKSIRTYGPVLAIVQTLASENQLAPDQKLAFIQHFARVIDPADDKNSIKILQILLILISSETVSHAALCSTVLSLCIKAFASKNALVRGTVLAVLQRQEYIMFSLFNAQAETYPPGFEASELHKIALEQLEELVAICGDKYKFLNHKGMGMDLLSTVLSESGRNFHKDPRIVELFSTRLFPVLQGYLGTPTLNPPYAFPMYTRAAKLSVQIILSFKAFYGLLSPLMSSTSSLYVWVQPWLRYLALESFCAVLSGKGQIRAMHVAVSSETHRKVLKDLVSTVAAITGKMPERLPGERTAPRLMLIRGKKAMEVSEAAPIEPPRVIRSQFIAMLGETLSGYVNGLEETFVQEGVALGELPQTPFTPAQTDNAIDPLQHTWKQIYELLMLVLKESFEEGQVQRALRGIQSLANMTGSVKMSAPFRFILKGLCQLCLPVKLTSYFDYQTDECVYDVGYKHVLMCGMIFNIAQCLHRIIDQNSWIVLLEALQKIACLIARAEYERAAVTPNVLNFNVIGSRVLENLKRFSARESKIFETPQKALPETPKTAALVAGTGGEEEKVKEEAVNSPSGKCFVIKPKESPSEKLFHDDSPLGTGLGGKKSKKSLSVCHFTESSIPASINRSVGPNMVQLNSLIMYSQESPAKGLHMAQKTSPAAMAADFESMKTALESLFTITSKFSDKTLYEFVMALGEVTLSMLENLAGGAQAQRGGNTEIQNFDKLNMFGLIRMLETTIINVDRVHILWDAVSAHIDCLANSKFVQLRSLAIDAITCLINNIFLAHEKAEAGEMQSRSDSYRQFWHKNAWQTRVLSPLLNALSSGHTECVRTVMHNLPNILENCGGCLSHEGWEMVFRILDSISSVAFSAPPGTDPYERVDLGFKCVESVVCRHLDKIDAAGFIHLLNAVHRFASYKSDVNIPTVALGLVQTIADHVSTSRPHGTSEERLYEIWVSIATRLKDVGCDERAEIRSRAYNTIEHIFIDNGDNIATKVWNFTFVEVFAQLLHFVELRFLACRTDKGQGIAITTPTNIATPKFSVGAINENKNAGRVMRFDEEAIKKERAAAEDGKLKEKQWEESVSSLVNMFVRVFMKFSQLVENSPRERQDIREKVLTVLLDAGVRLMRRGTYSIVNTVFRSLQQLTQACPDSIYKRFEETWKVFEEFMQWIGSERQDARFNQRPIGSKLAPAVVDSLRTLLRPEFVHDNPVVQSNNTVQGLYLLLRRLLSCSQTSEGFQGIATPQKLLAEEKSIFGYIEEMIDSFPSEEHHRTYFEFLLSFLKFRPEEPHIDAFIRRALSVILNHIVSGKLSPELLKEILPVLYKHMEELIKLRYNSAACKMLLFSSKDFHPLWYDVGVQAMNISAFLLSPETYRAQLVIPFSPPSSHRASERSENPFELAASGKKERVVEEIEQPEEKEPGQEDNNVVEQEQNEEQRPPAAEKRTPLKKRPKLGISIPEDEEAKAEPAGEATAPPTTEAVQDEDKIFPADLGLIPNKELQELAWPLTLHAVKEILYIDEQAMLALDKYLAEDVAKRSQDLGINIVNFIFKSLLPNSGGLSSSQQAELIEIVDHGCTVLTSAAVPTGGSLGGFSNDALSRHCIYTLIDMCAGETEKRKDEAKGSPLYSEVRLRVAALATPVLVNRCKATVKKFLADEKRNGLVPMPKVTDMISLLEKLTETTITANSLPQKKEVTRRIFATGKGHLVYLMPEMVECINSKEVELRLAVKDVLMKLSELLIGDDNF